MHGCLCVGTGSISGHGWWTSGVFMEECDAPFFRYFSKWNPKNGYICTESSLVKSFMETVLDPLRHIEVASTPEERVRQWFISLLMDSGHVPPHMMMSETGFRFGAKQYRADILVYGRDGSPLAVVECKRPEVKLGPSVLEQALRYNIVLSVRWIMVTNGQTTFVYQRDGARFLPCDHIPDYEEMTCQQ